MIDHTCYVKMIPLIVSNSLLLTILFAQQIYPQTTGNEKRTEILVLEQTHKLKNSSCYNTRSINVSI